jgi:hypothetical protein
VKWATLGVGGPIFDVLDEFHRRATLSAGNTDLGTVPDLGLQVDDLTGGCGGLAGSWGFENGKYGISVDCGEQARLPAVRAAAPGTWRTSSLGRAAGGAALPAIPSPRQARTAMAARPAELP